MKITGQLYQEVRQLCDPICRSQAIGSGLNADNLVDEISNMILFRLHSKGQVQLERYVRNSARLESHLLKMSPTTAA